MMNMRLRKTILAGTFLFSMAGISGCADENDPATHIKQLSDPATRSTATKRLIQFYSDAMIKDGDNREGPNVKPLLDKIVPPLTERCVAGDLDERTNTKLVEFISDSRDPRGESCLVKTLKDYKPDSTEDDVRWAVRAIGAMKLKSAAQPLIDVFLKIKPSKPKANAIHRDVYDAMIAVADPSWENQLISIIGRPINTPKEVTDEGFWQITSAELLGKLKSNGAIVPLLKTVLSPTKVAAHTTAILALTKIGKPVLEPTISLLKSENKELVDFATVEAVKALGDKATADAKKQASSAHVGMAALVLATMGREEAKAPLVSVMEKAEDVPRAIIARELTKLPKSPDLQKSFQDAFDKTPATLTIPPGNGAREALLEASTMFFDASFVPWIVKSAIDLKGEDADVAPVREASLLAAMKLMTAEQVADVQRLYDVKSTGSDGKPSTVGKGFEKEFNLAKGIVTECTNNVDCYLKKMTDSAAQERDKQFAGMKAAYMVGALGGPETRTKIIEQMPKLKNAAIRFIAVTIIDVLSPKGDTDIAAKLQKIVDDGVASKDPNVIAGNQPFKTVIYRLTTRAQ